MFKLINLACYFPTPLSPSKTWLPLQAISLTRAGYNKAIRRAKSGLLRFKVFISFFAYFSKCREKERKLKRKIVSLCAKFSLRSL